MVACPSCGNESPERYRRCGFCGTVLAPSRVEEEIRREVTIVTSDWKGSTALGERLDPESLREVQTRYFDAMRALFESRGGTIEKIIGDAIVAVFGLPTRHADDALRAVRAAAESLRVLANLNELLEKSWGVQLTTRTGVATGEVIVGEARSGQHVLTGEALQIATAMEQNAPAAEVLVAESTIALVRDEVTTEELGEFQPKGVSRTVAGHRLIAVSEASEDAAGSERTASGIRICQVCGEENPVAFRRCGTCGSALADAVPVHETRKTVTIVFADPKPSSADGSSPSPEAMGGVMTRYFEGMQRALDRHGATVEKFIGDAVMAVFGLPTRHEDDALRAVRAAADMQSALPELNASFERDYGITLANHIGVNTGEVVAGDASSGQRLVTGDTVNVAARLEQASGPHEILLGDLTYRLVRDAVTVEPVPPLTLKGKSEPLPAYRLVDVSQAGEGIRRHLDTPMVGRDREMTALGEIFERAVAQRSCVMATVIGDAGVGKSRLVAEFAGQRQADAVVLRGKCLPYGDGITFWPLREVARNAASIADDDPSEVALAKLRAIVDDQDVVERLASAVGLSSQSFPVTEIFWSARRFLEGLAAARPVVMIVDDIHWAEPTFLDLIGHLTATAESAPILVLCSSRHDLLETHPDWALDAGSLRVVLEPLTDADAALVVESLLGGTGLSDQVREKILQAAAGNPLFVEQLLSMLIDNGSLRKTNGRWEQVSALATLEVPPSIQALLAARIDLLADDERAVIEPASVIGQSFLQAAVEELVAEEAKPGVPAHLTAMNRKQLVLASDNSDSDEQGYRFGHVLIRDAAYGGLLKRARALLHERFVNWAEVYNEQRGQSGQEFEEIHGYHLEQSYAYLTELGAKDDHVRAVGIRASAKLASAGRRAMARGDLPAAASLLRRAAATRVKLDPERVRLLPDIAVVLTELGTFEEVAMVLADAFASSADVGDELVAAHARLVQLYAQLYSGQSDEEGHWSSSVEVAADHAVPLFEAAAYESGLTFAWRMRAGMYGAAQQTASLAVAAEQVVSHARRAGDPRAEVRGAIAYASAAVYGPTPVDQAIERCEELLAAAAADQHAAATIQLLVSQLYAMRGDFDHARTLYRAAHAKLEELRAGIYALSTSSDTARVEMLAGDYATAEQLLRSDFDALGAVGEQYSRSSIAGLLARALEAQGKLEEAAEVVQTAEDISAPDDVEAQVIWRGAKARVVARQGDVQGALILANEAVRLGEQADTPILAAEAIMDLAAVLRAADQPGAAETALAKALAIAKRKQDRCTARRVGALRDAAHPRKTPGPKARRSATVDA
jgi:class 3 adenylate cyclase/predicted ATPase